MSIVIPEQQQDWLNDFARLVRNHEASARDVLASLVQMGVEAPHESHLNDRRPGDWLANPKHQKAYNAKVWKILASDKKRLQEVRQAMHEDILTTNPVAGMEDFGHIVEKSYGRAMLEHFLWANPDNVTWM